MLPNVTLFKWPPGCSVAPGLAKANIALQQFDCLDLHESQTAKVTTSHVG